MALTRYPRTGASSRVRFYQFRSYLEQTGFDIRIEPFFSSTYLTRLYATGDRNITEVLRSYIARLWLVLRNSSVDILWIEKELLPLLPGGMERVLLSRAGAVVLDFDDAVYLGGETLQLPAGEELQKYNRLLRYSSLVTVGSQALASWAEDRGAARVVHLPSSTALRQRKRKPGRYFTLGWIGSPSTLYYLEQIFPELETISSIVPFQLLVMGATPRLSPSFLMHVVPWSEEKEDEFLDAIDVGLAPLPDTPWCRAKCGYKIVQYMSASIPTVASAVGENMKLILHGETGYLVQEPNQWSHFIVALHRDPALRDRLGNAAYRRASNEFSVGKTAARLTDLFRGITAANG